MEQNTASTNIRAWVERITRTINAQVDRAGELGNFGRGIPSHSDIGGLLKAPRRKLVQGSFGHDLGHIRNQRGYRSTKTTKPLGARVFTSSNRAVNAQKKRDKATTVEQRLPAPELTHARQHIQSYPLPQGQTRSREDNPVVAIRQEDHSGARMVLRAPAQTPVPSARQQEVETQAQTNERTVTEAASEQELESQPVDLEEVADKVYRLMRRELIIEGERATRPRGRLGG